MPRVDESSHGRSPYGNQVLTGSTISGCYSSSSVAATFTHGHSSTKEFPGAHSKAPPQHPPISRRAHQDHNAEIRALRAEPESAKAVASEHRDYTQNLITEWTAENIRKQRLEEHHMQTTTELHRRTEQLEEKQTQYETLWQQRRRCLNELQVFQRTAYSEERDVHKRVEHLSQQNNHKTRELQMQGRYLEETHRELSAARKQVQTCESELQASTRMEHSERQNLDTELAEVSAEHKIVEELKQYNSHKMTELREERQDMDERHADILSAWNHIQRNQFDLQKANEELQKKVKLCEKHTAESQSSLAETHVIIMELRARNVALQSSVEYYREQEMEHFEKHQRSETSIEADQRDRAEMRTAVLKLQSAVKELHAYHIRSSSSQASLAEHAARRGTQGAASCQRL